MKYKVGDIVVIKDNLILNKYYGNVFFTGSMFRKMGAITKITCIYRNMEYYDLEIDSGRCGWTDGMLAKVKTNERG